MQVDDPRFGELVFDLVNGYRDLQAFPVQQSRFVVCEFEEGRLCDVLYEEILGAYARICERLHLPDCRDADVEQIINQSIAITRHIALKMFEYGVFFTRRELCGMTKDSFG